MASKKVFLLFLLLLFSTDLLTPTTCEKVSVCLYYESLCPDSARFVVDSVAVIFSDGLIDVVDLNLVPWGNAKLYSDDTFKCQHGSYECLLNTVEACAIDAWPDVNDHFPFIYCVESLVLKHNYTYWETCFEKLGLDASVVADCYTSAHGKELELKYAAQTTALQPPHRYVPWVVVDGEPLYDDYENFASYICEAYKGTAKPSACGEPYVAGYIRKLKMINFIKTLHREPPPVKTKLLSWLKRFKIIASF